MKAILSNLRFMVMVLIVIALLAVSAYALPAGGNTPPSVNSIEIQPETPTKYDDLTCFVEVSDEDGNLDYVYFAWYVNGVLTRENTRLVYGARDSASDTLDSFHTEAGDYIVCKVKAYDFDRAYDLASHAVHVGNSFANSMPTVSYVEITPRHPNPQQDLTCSALVADADDNLDYVIFEWYRNNHVIRTAAKNVEGSSDVAYDILDSSRTYPGDWIKCKVNVYDTYGAGESEYSLPVVISGEYPYPPYPPPYNKRPVAVITANDYAVVAGEYVRFSGSQSYDVDGYVIQYKFDYGDGTESAWLPESYSYHSYANPGVYYARVKVKDNNYAESGWSRPVKIEVHEGYPQYGHKPLIDDIDILAKSRTGYTEFRCEAQVYDTDGDLDYVKFKWYLNGDLVTEEKAYVSGREDEAVSSINLALDDEYTLMCRVTVYDEEHNSDHDYRTIRGQFAPAGACKLSVKRFDYYSYLREGMDGWAEIEIENTGERPGTLTTELYVDGTLTEKRKVYLGTGESREERFEFPLSTGTHKIRVEAYLPCSKRVKKYAEITVFPLTSDVFIPESGEEEEAEITETGVIIRPSSLDIELGSGKTLEVVMKSPESTEFGISVEGIPEDWVNYPGNVEVEGKKTAYVYVVPKELGNYEFRVVVTAGSERFEEQIHLYVAPSGEDGGKKINGLTGLISIAQSNWAVGAAIVSVLVLLVIVYFFAGKFGRKTYEDYAYPQTPRPAMRGAGMMKGSAGRNPDMSRLLPAEVLRYSDGTSYPKLGSDYWGGNA